jgi:hypothetical protein
MSSPTEIISALFDLGEIFGQLSTKAINLYIEALEDLPSGALAAARDKLLREHARYFPTPGEIRAAAAGDPDDYPALPPPPKLSAEERVEKERLRAEVRDWIATRRLGVLDENWFDRASLEEVKRVVARWYEIHRETDDRAA